MFRSNHWDYIQCIIWSDPVTVCCISGNKTFNQRFGANLKKRFLCHINTTLFPGPISEKTSSPQQRNYTCFSFVHVGSLGLSFFNPRSQLRCTDVIAFCMQLGKAIGRGEGVCYLGMRERGKRWEIRLGPRIQKTQTIILCEFSGVC